MSEGCGYCNGRVSDGACSLEADGLRETERGGDGWFSFNYAGPQLHNHVPRANGQYYIFYTHLGQSALAEAIATY
jgi:hypothetical protein